MRGLCLLWLSAAWVLCTAGAGAGTDELVGASELPTVAEASGYEATSTSEQVQLFLRACDERAEHVWGFEFGRTSQDRSMSGVVIADPPVQPRAGDPRLVIMLLGNIHSGECDGKEALLMLARELTLTAQHPWLRRAVFVFVPNYNADGNDQMSVDNRPGQIGPVRGMGRRETAQGFDLNRDFVRLETAEGKALVRLIDQWNPHMFIDCHTTNGSIHRYPLTYDIPHNPAVVSELRSYLREQLMPAVSQGMRGAGFETFYYGNFAREHTRWESFGFEPRYSTEYLGLRGRIGILSESYSYADYRTRVLASREFVRQCVNAAIDRADEIKRVLGAIEESAEVVRAAGSAAEQLPLNAELRPFEQKFRVLGRVPGSDEPRDYEVEYWGRYDATKRVELPFAYVLSEVPALVLQNLSQHGVRLERLREAVSVSVRVQRVTGIRRSATAFQKHQLVQLETESQPQIRELRAGSVIVRTAQPLGRLAAWLLEAESCDGLTTWNFFDAMLREGGEYPVLAIPEPVDLSVEAVAAGSGP